MYMPNILKRGENFLMEIIIYGLIFIIGTLFGSFFTLAVYRIPLGENILYKHSFCPNCKEKLKFKDLIPVISYIALGGKCAYCGQKIRIRYLLLEILSGTVFLLFALSLNADVYNLNADLMIYFILFILYIASLFIIAGIDKEKIQIQNSLLIFGMFIAFMYMTYVCIHNDQAIYTYIMYLILTIIVLTINIVYIKKKLHDSYTIQVLMLILYMLVFSGATLMYTTIIITLLGIAIGMLVIKLKEHSKSKSIIKDNDIKIPIGFYLCVSNIILILINNFLYNWVI